MSKKASLHVFHHVKKLFQTVVVGGLLITILMAFFSMMANFSFFSCFSSF